MKYWPYFLFIAFCIYMAFYSSKRKKQEAIKKQQEELRIKQVTILNSISQRTRIINDCKRIVDTSTNLETVKYRYQLALDEVNKAVSEVTQLFQSDEVRALAKDLKTLQSDLTTEGGNIVKQAIYRAFGSEMIAISKLKTDSGKIKRQDKFYKKVCDLFPEQEPYIRDLVGYDVFGK